MISAFGMVLKKYRDRDNDSLEDLSTKLAISLTDLSAMEVGRKIVPYNIVLKLISIYHLDNVEKSALIDAVDETNRNVEDEILIMNNAKANTSMMLAREVKVKDSNLLSKLKEALADEED